MESFLFRKKKYAIRLHWTSVVAICCSCLWCRGKYKAFFSKSKNLEETTWPPLDRQDWLLSPVCFCQSNNDIWSTRQAPEYSFWALGLQVLLSSWASKNLKITDMCSSQIFKDLSASCKQFLSLAFSLQMKFFSHISNDRKEFLQTSYLPHP